MTTAHIGHRRAAFKFLDDTVEGRQPTRYEIGIISRTKESFSSMKEAGVVLSPFHPLTRLEIFDCPIQGMESGLDDVVCARHINRSVGIGEASRLFGIHRPTISFGIKLHISAGALVAEPFTNVSFVRAGFLSQLRGGESALCQLPIETEPITDQNESCAHRRAEVAYCLAEKGVELRFVDRHANFSNQTNSGLLSHRR